MIVQVQFRRDTALDWQAKNPLLAKGEPGYETDTRRLKIGDGVTLWNTLPYWGGEGGGTGGPVEWGDILNKPTVFPAEVTSGDIVDFIDAVDAVVSGRYVAIGSATLGIDEDGVPYLVTAEATPPAQPGSLLFDSDGVPYFVPPQP